MNIVKICVFCASSERIRPQYLEMAEAFGRELATRGHQLVYGGGKIGLMGAVYRGAKAVGTHITG
ncbi:MAG: TIGR00730 family Rossman fold protein, partial [Lentisphaerae bacterium]